MYPTFRITDNSYVFGAPYSEEVKRRSSIFSTNLTMANADADRISLDLKSNFAAIAAARPIPHLELLCRFLMAVSRSTRDHDPVMTAGLNVDSGRPVSASGHCRRGVALTMGATFTGFKIDCQYVVQLLQSVSTISPGDSTKVRR